MKAGLATSAPQSAPPGSSAPDQEGAIPKNEWVGRCTLSPLLPLMECSKDLRQSPYSSLSAASASSHLPMPSAISAWSTIPTRHSGSR